jgi:hypothetical protein
MVIFRPELDRVRHVHVFCREDVVELASSAAVVELFEKGLRCDCVSMADCIAHGCSPPVVQVGFARAGNGGKAPSAR